MRKASSNWLGKTIMAVVMGVLIVSFGIWGIADIFRGFGQSTLATIGHTEISINEFRQLYTDKLQQIGRQYGRPLTTDQARAFGIDRQVLQQTIAEAALDEQARRLGLGQSDAETMRVIFSDPNFKGVNGNFDPQRFQAVIRQFGFTEQRYIADQRKVSLRRQIAGTISAGLEPSKAMIEALSRFQNEQRNIEYVKLDAAQAGTIDPPSPEALAAYFDDHKAQFRAPEYRKIAFVAITPDEIGKWTDVSDDDAKKLFEQRRGQLGAPEKREVSQMVFPNEGEAAAARSRIASGLSFDDLAKERGLKPADVDIGMVSKSEIIDPAVASAAFSLPTGEVSQPVQGKFGVALVKVGKIEAGAEPKYEDFATDLKTEIAVERARTKVAELRDKMEDERGGGASVTEAAQKLGLAAVTIDAVDRSGRTPNGQPAAGIPARSRYRLAGLQQRRRRRQRSDLVQGRLCLVRRARHHPLARAQPRRGQGPGRSALARRPDHEPAQDQGDRDGAEARPGRQACGRGGNRGTEGGDRERIQARRLAARRARRRDRGGVPYRQGWRRADPRRRQQRVDRLPRHRRHRAAGRLCLGRHQEVEGKRSAQPDR